MSNTPDNPEKRKTAEDILRKSWDKSFRNMYGGKMSFDMQKGKSGKNFDWIYEAMFEYAFHHIDHQIHTAGYGILQKKIKGLEDMLKKAYEKDKKMNPSGMMNPYPFEDFETWKRMLTFDANDPKTWKSGGAEQREAQPGKTPIPPPTPPPDYEPRW